MRRKSASGNCICTMCCGPTAASPCNSLEARVPFGDLAFVRYAMAIDPALKMNRHDMGKYLIRQAFADDHILPEEILWRQKAAFSDAVGHSMVDDLKAYAEIPLHG